MNGYLPVITILLGNAPVTGVVAARIFPGDAPQGKEYPLIMVETFDMEPFDTKSGASSVDHDAVRVMCYADTDHQAQELNKLVRNAIDEKGAGTFGGYTIENIRFLRGDSFDTNVTNRRIRVHESDYEVRIKQT